MYKTILVPLDGSKRAEMILPHVEELARHYNSKVVFLQVVEYFPLIMGDEEASRANWELHRKAQDTLNSEAKSYLASLQGEFREKGIQAVARVVHGPVVREIMNAAEREKANLIAIASHGRSGLTRVFYGSVAASILHRADRPLLLIRAQAEV
jgi:nucleotide-binding universal stress UspA family protein